MGSQQQSMKQALIFKYLDLTALMACILMPLSGMRSQNLWDEISKMERCYLIGGGYIVVSCILNRFLFSKGYRTALRKRCEIISMFFLLFTILLRSLVWHYNTGTFAIPYVVLMTLGIGWGIMYVALTFREMMKLIKTVQQ